MYCFRFLTRRCCIQRHSFRVYTSHQVHVLLGQIKWSRQFRYSQRPHIISLSLSRNLLLWLSVGWGIRRRHREIDCFRLSAARFAFFVPYDFENCVSDFWDTPVRLIEVYARVLVRLLPILPGQRNTGLRKRLLK